MTEITELLDKKESLRVMALLPSENHLASEKLSLFERFSLVCENLYLLKNNFLAADFLELLRQEIGLSLSSDISIDREAQKQIWRALCSYGGDGVPAFSDCNIKNYTVDTVKLSDFTDINKYLLSSKREELDMLISELVNNSNRPIYFDMSHMPYVRPDPYHADIAYKKLLNSDPSEKELSLLIAWILCKMLSQKKLDLYIKIGDNTDEALRFIELLKARKIASSVCLCIDKTKIDGASEAARKCFGAELTNIYLGLLNDSDKEFSDASFYLPLNRIKHCEI